METKPTVPNMTGIESTYYQQTPYAQTQVSYPPTNPIPSLSVPSKRTRLIVNYIPSDITAEQFKEMFVPFGKITNNKLVTTKEGVSLGYGFIEYESETEAAEAINSMNKKQIGKKQLKVSYARNPSPEIKNANMYISGIPQEWTVEQLQQYFSNYGTIITANLLRDEYGKSKGCGFVRMSTHAEAENAVRELNGKTLGTKPLVVKIQSAAERMQRKQGYNKTPGMAGMGTTQGGPAGMNGGYYRYNNYKYNRSDPSHPTLFVFGIPQENPEEWLRQCFSPYGVIEKVNVPRLSDGNHQPYGFVTYNNLISAQYAISCLNGYPIEGGKHLQVSFKTEKARNPRNNHRMNNSVPFYNLSYPLNTTMSSLPITSIPQYGYQFQSVNPQTQTGLEQATTTTTTGTTTLPSTGTLPSSLTQTTLYNQTLPSTTAPTTQTNTTLYPPEYYGYSQQYLNSMTTGIPQQQLQAGTSGTIPSTTEGAMMMDPSLSTTTTTLPTPSLTTTTPSTIPTSSLPPTSSIPTQPPQM